jgi:hypothetical protein
MSAFLYCDDCAIRLVVVAPGYLRCWNCGRVWLIGAAP